jgi:hypothetical protein
MTSRERLLKVLTGQKPDRTPVTLFVTDTDIEDGPPNCILEERTHDPIADLIKFHEILGLDIMLRISVDVFEPIAFNIDTEDWENSWEYSEDRKHLTHIITTPGGILTETFNMEGEEFHGDPSNDWMKLRNVRTKSLVTNIEDLKIIKEYRPGIPQYNLGNIPYITKKLGDRGLVLPRVASSVYNSAYGLRKLEDLLMDPLLKPDLYRELMEFCTNDVIEVGKQITKAGGDVMRIVGNVANSGMVSPKFYSDYVYPYEKRYVDSLTSGSCKVLFHNCGQCASLLETYGDMLDNQALESLSTSGSGGDITSLKSARECLGDRVTIVGNFDQVNLLKNGTKDQIREQVRHIFDETRSSRRFIFSTSDSIVPGTPKENIEAMVQCALECASAQ